jgi:hypothetical protein
MRNIIAVVCAGALASVLAGTALAGGPPGYEPAYFNGSTVTINAIEVSQKNPVPAKAQADFYEVVYPTDWQARHLAPPQCNPCDHDNNGIDPEDFHDHILDSVPANPGGGDFNPHWHVFVVVPAYSPNHSDPAHDQAVGDAYAAAIPTTSEAAVNALLAKKLPDGSPVAIEIDTHFYFICAVVNPHAAH